MPSYITHLICSRRISSKCLLLLIYSVAVVVFRSVFQNAGFTILRAFDIWDKAINNYNLNFSHPAELQDINQLSPDYLKSFSPDVIIGGPPCQDYSSAGKQDETLGRANLTLRYAELVCSVRSRWFVMENVDRILKSSTLPKALALFRNAGYGLSQVVLDASRCGVPQKRKRFFSDW